MDRRSFLCNIGAFVLTPILLPSSKKPIQQLQNMFWDDERKKWQIIEKRLAAILMYDSPFGWIDNYEKDGAIFYDINPDTYKYTPRPDLDITKWLICKKEDEHNHYWKIKILNDYDKIHRRTSLWLSFNKLANFDSKLVTQYLEIFIRLWLKGKKGYNDYLPISANKFIEWRTRYEC